MQGRTFMHGACASTTHRYLTVQLVRFFYKVDTQNKAKVLRKVRAHCVCACALCVCVCVCVCKYLVMKKVYAVPHLRQIGCSFHIRMLN
jgi:hypothetical protein